MMIHRRKIFVYRALVGLRMFLGVNSTVLGFQDSKTQSFVIRGSSLVASAPMGSSLIDERLKPLCSKPKKYSVQQQLFHEFTPKSTITAPNMLLLALDDCPQLQKVFIYPKTPFQAQIELLSNTQAHTISILFSPLKALFLSLDFFSLFPSLLFSGFLLISQ